jgi:2'-5' RNA ligase
MRLFIALELGEEVLREAAALVEELKQRMHRRSPDARLTWVTPDRMHLTLRFLGEVRNGKESDVLSALRDPIAMPPFDVAWQGLGAFPPKGPPRVLWVGAGRGRESVLELEKAVSARLEPLGFEQEARPFAPHLTLARVREARGLRPAALFEGIVQQSLGTTTVDAMTLFESTLSPKGPTYVTMQRTPLRG